MPKFIYAHNPSLKRLRRDPRVTLSPYREDGKTIGYTVIKSLLCGNTGNLS